MKVVSHFITPQSSRASSWNFFCTPYLSQRSLKFRINANHINYLPDFLLFNLLLFSTIILAQEVLQPLNYFRTLLVAPSIYFLTEAVGAFGQILFSWKRKDTFPIHWRPLLSTSLSQFWGRRWNLWVQDWLKDVSSLVSLNHPKRKMVMTFIVSGFFHEIMVNFPYWLIYKKSYFGTMMLYFLIQAAALYVDKKILKGSPLLLRRAFLWLLVLLPSPLFVNVPLLTFLGLNHG